ncbi:nitrate reductase molybdenum cofactor assembly chaperone [Actinomadura sp. HBU206391]|uniref:nitrate reductase molybdenum cofactor assembly chaperone n=1 Tax=Actinomadura sp. HBU206391 TaxID=2731692 RepID=UPI0016505DBA|nr:nitrate reductase molybdenum cofactor assembly chaperone [Actinomadura sp. HBU206391]MBC6459675.1 nitrate reductase molybdenum cofactor assembly chaperone [Actinomadura sp. HBU206391]
MRRSDDRRAPAWAPSAWQAQSLLLAYPDERLLRQTEMIGQVAARLPDPVGGPLTRFLDHLGRTRPTQLAVDYVATFDHRKRCCLFLTYYAHGDTRKRGVALLRMKQTYAAAGLRLADDELPDHLAVVLEFAAAEARAGRRLLLEHRAGLELLRLALRDANSPWADVLESVSATLPTLAGDERGAVARLAAQGPPEEQVGLAPFGSPVFLPDPYMPTPVKGVR